MDADLVARLVLLLGALFLAASERVFDARARAMQARVLGDETVTGYTRTETDAEMTRELVARRIAVRLEGGDGRLAKIAPPKGETIRLGALVDVRAVPERPAWAFHSPMMRPAREDAPWLRSLLAGVAVIGASGFVAGYFLA